MRTEHWHVQAWVVSDPLGPATHSGPLFHREHATRNYHRILGEGLGARVVEVRENCAICREVFAT